MLEIVKRHLTAFSTSNWDEYRAALATEALYDDVPSTVRSVGIEAYVSAVQRWKVAFPDMRAQIVRAYSIGERVIIEAQWEGTQAGPIDGVFGYLPPTHRRARINAVLLYTVRAGKIVDTRHYYDMLTLLTQLGAPAPLDKLRSIPMPR